MNHYDHMRLLRPAITAKRQIWADLGSGDGAFTLALAELGGEQTVINSIDTDASRLDIQKKHFAQMFPKARIHYFTEDFTHPLDVPLLDGILMANSLHFIEKQVAFLIDIKDYLKPSGELIIVEYNSDNPNQWVPYPLSFRRLETLAEEAGFTRPEKIGSHPSEFMKEIYSAVLKKR